jgi:hypothetical protein
VDWIHLYLDGFKLLHYMNTIMNLCFRKKQFPYMPRRRLGERNYSSYSITTSALDGVSGQRHAPAAFYPPGKDSLVPTVQEAGWTPEPDCTQRLQKKSFCLCRGSNLDRPFVLVQFHPLWYDNHINISTVQIMKLLTVLHPPGTSSLYPVAATARIICFSFH